MLSTRKKWLSSFRKWPGRPWRLLLPVVLGVGRSLNYYPLGEEEIDDGVVEMAVGLGKYIVDGAAACVSPPLHPEHALQTSTLDLALRDTQRKLFCPQLRAVVFGAARRGANLIKKNVQDFAGTGVLRYMVSSYDPFDGMLRDYEFEKLRRVVTFSNILRDKALPLAEALHFMLREGQTAMQRPVEIEFAGNIFAKPTPRGHQRSPLLASDKAYR